MKIKNNKNLIAILVFAILVNCIYFANENFSRVLWPSTMNLYNDAIDLDKVLPETATSSGSKKGLLLTGNVQDIFTLGAGHVAVNMTLSGQGHTFIQLLQGLKKRGIKITLIVCNDKAPIGINLKDAPDEFKKPYFYMMDFSATNGNWQKYNFDRIVEDYGDYVDNWILGNEINCQTYNFYGAADITDYTKVFCNTFKICYEKIKEKNENADVYISFDQGWDLPQQRKGDRRYNATISKYRYNMKEQLSLINKYLDKEIDWGVSLHPYPAPVDSAIFWDDQYAGYDNSSEIDTEQQILLTLKNFEVFFPYFADKKFLKKDDSFRNVIISEFGLTSNESDKLQAAVLYYMWEKVKDNPFIKCFIYNAQTDLDTYHFGLVRGNLRKKLSWAVFKDMDKPDEYIWCKDLLDEVLDEYGYVDIDGVVINKASLSSLQKQ